jgi:hypothetical protein
MLDADVPTCINAANHQPGHDVVTRSACVVDGYSTTKQSRWSGSIADESSQQSETARVHGSDSWVRTWERKWATKSRIEIA